MSAPCRRLFSALGACAILASLVSLSRTAIASTFSITTFNIRFYGLDGNMDNAPGSETRDASIRAHLERESALTDVIVFQEIVDVRGLAQKVLKNEYQCESYDGRGNKHQYVVICVKPHLRFVKASDDDDFVIDEVDLGVDSYRPAVHGLVTTRMGLPLAHVVAVHLKAQPDDASRQKRIKQAGLIRDYAKRRADQVPMIVLGDANTHGPDAVTMDGIFDEAGCGLKQLPVEAEYTWRTPSNGNKLDRVWASPMLNVKAKPHVAGPCNSRDTATIKTYNARVSDHCPVTMTIETPSFDQ